MSLIYTGNVTLGVGIPSLLLATAQLTSSLTPLIAQLNAQIAGLLTLSLAPPSVITDLIDNLLAVIAALLALIGSGLVVLPPTASASLETVAELQLTLAGLQAGLDFAAALSTSLGESVHVYAWTGGSSALGPATTGALSGGLPGGGGPSEDIDGIMLLANTPGAKAALQAIF